MPKLFRCFAVLFSFASVTASAFGATLQGQLVCNNGHSRATGVAVTLLPQGATSRQRTTPFFTGADGMYYLQGLAPGRYQLEIWLSRSSSAPSRTYPVTLKEPATIADTHALAQCAAN